MFGGKDKYMCLLSLIKRERPLLYDVISELCLDGTFRSQRYQNTFLMPSEELVKQLERMVANDKDDQAIDHIRSLLLKKHFELNDFKTKDIIMGTLQAGSKVLKSPSDVGKALSASSKMVYASKTGEATFKVYDYTGDKFPETVEGKSGGMVLASRGVMGGAEAKRLDTVRDLTNSLIVKGDAKKTIHNFFKAVAGVLAKLESDDSDKFDQAKFYLAANPILSWFFLTMPGSDHALVSEEHLKEFDFTQVVAGTDIISKCLNDGYSFDKELFKKINRCRTQLISEKGDKSSLMQCIKDSYTSMLRQLEEHQSVDSKLAGCADRKILMDELRFMYEGCVKHWEDVEDTLAALGEVNWHHPEKSHVLTNDDVYKKHMLKGTESFICGPVSFVKSVYFLYVPLTESIEQQLEQNASKVSGGGISGGNPNAINNMIFSGGAARKMQKKSADMKLASLVKVLSKAQRAALKELL
jgi:hypothetical protein